MDALLKQAMSGRQESVKELYEKYKGKVYLLCTSLIEDQDQADIVFMEIFKEIWKMAPQKSLDTLDDFYELLMRTSIKYCQNNLFSGNPHIFKDNKPNEFKEEEFKEKEATISYEKVLKYCNALSAPSRFIFVSGLVTGFSARQIAQAINVEEIVVDSYIQDALYELKDKKVEQYKSAFEKARIQVNETSNSMCLGYIEEITKVNEPSSKWKRIIGVALVCGLLVGIIAFVVGPKTNETSSNEDVTTEESVEEDTTDVVVTENYIADINVKDYGTITVELNGEVAPRTVQNFVDLAQSGFYDGLTFHRIIDGFMIQGGDPNGDGTGGSTNNVVGEFSANGYENNLSHVRGTISMARSSDYDSGSSQFFIVQSDSTNLDGQYAAFGTVTSGMDIVDQICKDVTPYDNNGSVYAEEQPVIESITIRTA